MILFNICFDRKVKQRDSTGIEPQPDKTSEVCKLIDDHVFVKPAEPKSTIESKDLSLDNRQNKDKLVSIHAYICNTRFYQRYW